MSKTNKGGTRLRLVVGIAATTSVLAGIFAAHAYNKPLLASCSLPIVVKGSSPAPLTCSGLSASTTYYIYPSTMGEWDNTNTSGSGTLGSPFTFTSGSVSVTTDGSGNLPAKYFATESSGSTQANANLTVYTNPAPSGAVVTSSNMDIVRPQFSYSQSLTAGQPIFIQVTGLIAGKSYQLKPEISSVVDTTGWDVSNSDDGSTSGLAGAFAYADGNILASGSASPYLIDNSSGNYFIYMKSASSASGILFRLGEDSTQIDVSSATLTIN